MPTTARGIWTPSDTDAVDFTTHLATMAGTIDTAITNGLNTIGAGANAFKGTAAQRAAFLSTAVNGMLWQDTDGIKMIWRKDGAAWVPAVWRWSGTTAQMNAFTQALNGFEWFNTTDNSDYVRLSGAWSLTSGTFKSNISAPVALGGSWSMFTNLVASVNEIGATVASGAITLNKPGLVLISGKWQHNGNSNVSISTALTLNSTAQPTISTTLLDAAVTANGVEGTAIHRATTGDTLRMWAASGAAVSAIGQTGLSLAYL